MQLCFLISALSGSEKSKEIFWVVERLNFDSFLNWFEFNQLNNVQLRGSRTTIFKIKLTKEKYEFVDPCTRLTEAKFEGFWEKQTAWKYCMNTSIFIGSLVALFGIFGIAVFWYKIMMEYNERRGI